MKIRLNQIAVGVSILMFGLSLTQKCYCTPASCGDSLAALLSGTIGFIFGGAALAWLANPLLIISWFIVNKKPKLSLLFSLLAVLIAFSFLLFKRIISDEAGNYQDIVSYQLGYWLWIASSVVMCLGNWFLHFSPAVAKKYPTSDTLSL